MTIKEVIESVDKINTIRGEQEKTVLNSTFNIPCASKEFIDEFNNAILEAIKDERK